MHKYIFWLENQSDDPSLEFKPIVTDVSLQRALSADYLPHAVLGPMAVVMYKTKSDCYELTLK